MYRRKQLGFMQKENKDELELNTKRRLRILIAAGGTGGHLFPAVAVAEQLQKLTDNNIDIEFIGTTDRMESKLVPELGYHYHPIRISGYAGISIRSLVLPWRILNSLIRSRAILKVREIDGVVAAGAYISYPPALAASQLRVPYFLMESNVNPGKTNAKLAPNAEMIFTAFEESTNFYPPALASKLKYYGNPVRNFILHLPPKVEAQEKLELDKSKRTLLIMGGSLGARSINKAVEMNLNALSDVDLQIIWQTGNNYIVPPLLPNNIKQVNFISDMASAYAVADMILCRSGATTVAEICVAGKASILVPMPSASNNEQYQNAKVLADRNAAILVEDSMIAERIIPAIAEIAESDVRLTELAENALALAKPDAAEKVAQEILDYFYKRKPRYGFDSKF